MNPKHSGLKGLTLRQFFGTIRRRMLQSEFFTTFNFHDELSKGRSIILINNIVTAIINVFVTGVFYTGFLAVSGINIVNVGIITFIPYIAWAFSLFGPKIVSRFKSRRGLLIFNMAFYHLTTTLGVTLIPVFIKDPDARVIAFAVLVFLGNLSNALLSSAVTPWHVNFLKPDVVRNSFFSYNNIFSSLGGAGVALFTCFLADSVLGSPNEASILTLLRHIAFVLAIANMLALYLVPKEFPYPVTKKARLADVILMPIRNKKFLMTAVIAFAWSAICNLNSNTWNYFVLNTLHYSYLQAYTNTLSTALLSIFTIGIWKRWLNRFGFFPMLAVTYLYASFHELLYSFTGTGTLTYFIVLSCIDGFRIAGINYVSASLLYVNLPAADQDQYTVFWNCFNNMFVLLGSTVGTWLISITSERVTTILGVDFYISNFIPVIKCVLGTGVALYVILMRKKLDPNAPALK